MAHDIAQEVYEAWCRRNAQHVEKETGQISSLMAWDMLSDSQKEDWYVAAMAAVHSSAPKHFFLRHVPEQQEDMVYEVGFRRFDHPNPDDNADIWYLAVPSGPLADLSGSAIEQWLLAHKVAFEIFVAYKWGARPD